MGQTADQLREEIAAKREDAAAKIDRIEAKVQQIPQIARETVDASMLQARASVGEQVNQMAQKFDLRQQVNERPLLALGAALAGGWLLGKLTEDNGAPTRRGARYERDDRNRSAQTPLAAAGAGSYGMSEAATSTREAMRGQRAGVRAERWREQTGGSGGLVGSVREAARNAGLDDTLEAVTGALVATFTDQLRKSIDQNFPDFGRQLRNQEASAGAERQRGSAAWDRTYGRNPQPNNPSGSGYAYGTDSEAAMRAGAVDGAGTGPGEGGGYATETAHGTGVGFGTGASAGAYTDNPAGTAPPRAGGDAPHEFGPGARLDGGEFGPSSGMPGSRGHQGTSSIT
ncbi:MAG TPA: hypothetical protein VFU81_15925 [Thermomicrobiales bacterium]|nr:hypothetical protein [Thermomicrobiales bacterium]